MVDNGDTFSLLDIINKISTCELSNAACAWMNAKSLPRKISMLDYNSLQLDVKTDMAINYAQVTSTGKPEEYRKEAKDNTEKRGRDHQKYDINQEIRRAVLGTRKIINNLGLTNIGNQEVPVDNLQQDLNLVEGVKEVVKEVREDRYLEIEIQEEPEVPNVQHKLVDLLMI